MHRPSKQCTDRASNAPTEQMNTISFVGALLALASGKAERRQVHPLEGTHRIRLIRFLYLSNRNPINPFNPLLFLSQQ